jgi:hypothetical protein
MKLQITLVTTLLSLNIIAKEFFGKASLGEFNVEVTLNDETNKAKIEITGPSSSWFGVGFGSKRMNNTYTIFANENTGGSVSERILIGNSYGNALNSSVTSSFENLGLTTKYIIERPLVATNGGYSFTAQAGSIDIILAVGPNQTPGTYHGLTRAGTSINLIELNPTSTKDMAPKNFMKVYPNPTNSILNIECSEISDNAILKIMSVDGKIIKEVTVENVKNHVLDVSFLTNGTYLLMVQNSKWNSYFTFIKE